MKRILKALSRTSGTFWAELAPTIFFCVFICRYWAAMSETWDIRDAPVAVLVLLYPSKIWLMVWLRQKGGESWDYGHSKTLVTSGPYRISRNPVYALVMVQFVAWLLSVAEVMTQQDVWTDPTAHPVAWIAGATLALAWFWFYANFVAIPREERNLAADHPAEFSAYCRRVGRWHGAMRAQTHGWAPEPACE